jgi:conjugal transfer/entry exclusion protein
MLQAGYFSPQRLGELEVYVSLLDDDSSMPKQKMEEAIKHIKAVQDQIGQIQAQAETLQTQANNYIGQQQDITAIGNYGNQLYSQATM